MDDDKQAVEEMPTKCLISFYDHGGSLVDSFEFGTHIVINNIDIKDEWRNPFHHWEAVAI